MATLNKDNNWSVFNMIDKNTKVFQTYCANIILLVVVIHKEERNSSMIYGMMVNRRVNSTNT